MAEIFNMSLVEVLTYGEKSEEASLKERVRRIEEDMILLKSILKTMLDNGGGPFSSLNEG